jgi:serine/threonine protein kinase
LQPGSLIGPFVLDQRIRNGAFTQVWQAHHTLLSAVVAIKVIEKASISTPIGRTRLILLDLLSGARCNFDQWQRYGQWKNQCERLNTTYCTRIKNGTPSAFWLVGISVYGNPEGTTSLIVAM